MLWAVLTETLDTSPWSICFWDKSLPPMRCLIQSWVNLPPNWEEQALAGMTSSDDGLIESWDKLFLDGKPRVNIYRELYPHSLWAHRSCCWMRRCHFHQFVSTDCHLCEASLMLNLYAGAFRVRELPQLLFFCLTSSPSHRQSRTAQSWKIYSDSDYFPPVLQKPFFSRPSSSLLACGQPLPPQPPLQSIVHTAAVVRSRHFPALTLQGLSISQ